jgi:deoxyribodipyrimidine photo-lyase
MLPDDLREGRTGLAVIDRTVHTLYHTGYLHNHARMWLASYTVHLRKVHWRVAADWLYGHLLDGDLASNHLSWQWVAGTFSSKPYLFNAENVARFAPADWQCGGSAIDCSYEALEQIARSNETLASTPSLVGTTEPPLLPLPAPSLETPLPPIAAGRPVTLVHPWMLAGANDVPAGALRLGVIHAPFHQRFPWSAQRWDFVMTHLRDVTDALFIGDLTALRPVLAQAGEVSSVDTFNPGYRQALAQLCAQLSPAPRHFPDPEQACRSFSAFWNVCTSAGAAALGRSWHR